MGFRLRRSIRILPGIRVNVGKQYASVSLGVRGAHVTVRAGHKVRATVGVPGTGLSYTKGGGTERPATSHSIGSPPAAGITWRAWLLAAVVLAVILGMVMNNTQ
jgi:hypothetical protein